MGFDIDRLTQFAAGEIRRFAAENGGSDETFYAFAVWGDQLGLNTKTHVEAELLANATSTAPPVTRDELMWNPGQWAYLFAEFSVEDGFDFGAYQEHYELSEDPDNDAAMLAATEYANAMEQVLSNLKSLNAFDCLNTESGFVATRIESA